MKREILNIFIYFWPWTWNMYWKVAILKYFFNFSIFSHIFQKTHWFCNPTNKWLITTWQHHKFKLWCLDFSIFVVLFWIQVHCLLLYWELNFSDFVLCFDMWYICVCHKNLDSHEFSFIVRTKSSKLLGRF